MGGASGSRLPRSPPPNPPRSRRVPSSRELRPVPGGRRWRPCGKLGGGGGSGRAAGNFGGERRPLPRGGRGKQRAEFGGRGSGRHGRRSRRSWARGERRAAGPRSFPAGCWRLPTPEPLHLPAALPALPAATGSERKRNAGLPAAGRRGQRAGNGGGRERGGGEAAGGTEKWLELGGCGGACNFAERTRSEADAAGTGRDQVAVEISSGGERVCGAKGVRGGNHGRDGGGQQGGEQARRDEELPAAVRETLPGRAAAARGSEGAAGAGARRGPVGGASPSAHRRSCQGPGPSRSAVGWFQLPASRPPAPPAAARPPRSPPSSAGSGTRPRLPGQRAGADAGRGGESQPQVTNSGGSWAHAARWAGCARRAHVPARNTGVCVCTGDADIYMGLDLYLMARIKLLKVAAM